MEADDVYRALQRHLDRMPVPFPPSESGVELRILKQLFTPDEARLALQLSAIPEPLATIHRRVRREMTTDELRAALDRMAEKGSIQKLRGKSGPRYGKSPLAVGMYEAQVDRLTPQLERDVRAYMAEAFGPAMFSTVTKQMRTVPVHKSIPVERPVATHDNIRAFVESIPGPFAVIPCVCRQGRALTGEPCQQTPEPRNCLLFGAAASFMVDRGVGRPVSKEEMLAFLEQADRQGLVLQPQNTANPLFVCCCCGCCCGVLTTAKKHPRPADYFQADFVAVVDSEKCRICGTCATRCQMDAIDDSGGASKVIEERCIGCGLCVTTCPSEAVSLRPHERRAPPPNARALYSRMFKERYGALGAAAALAAYKFGRKF